MTTDAKNMLIAYLNSLARTGGLLVSLIGALVLVGWFLDIAALKSVIPGLAAMKPNTALGFLLTGLSLWRQQPGGWIAKPCALLAAVLGLLTIGEYLLGSDFGIDQILFKDNLKAAGTSFPARMAPNTALSFLFIGGALLFLNYESRTGHRPSQLLALAPALIGLLAIAGYAYRITSYGFPDYTEMAFHTAAAFVILSVGALLTSPDRGIMKQITGDNFGGMTARRLLPAAFGIPLVLGWFCLEGQRAGFFGMEFGLSLLVVASIAMFTIVIWINARILNQLGDNRKQAELASEVRYLEFQWLYEIGREIINSVDIKIIMDGILEKTYVVRDFDIAVIRLLNAENSMLEVATSRGYRNPENIRPLSTSAGDATFSRTQTEVFTGTGAYVAENIAATRGFRTFKREGVVSMIVVPIRAGDEILGTLQLGSRVRKEFQPAQIRLLEAIGNHLGIAVQNSRLHQATLQSLERIRALHEIDKAIISSLDLHAVLTLLLEKIDLFLPYAVTTVRLVNRETGALEPVACRNLDAEEWRAATPAVDLDGSGMLPDDNSPLFTRNVQTDPGSLTFEFLRKHGLVSSLRVPFLVKGQLLGVITFFTREEHEFNAEEISLLSTVAGQAAIAIHNSQLYEAAQRREAEIQDAHRQLQALYAITAATSQSLQIGNVLSEVLRKITEIFDFNATRIFFFDSSRENFNLAASYETSPDLFEAVPTFRRGQGLIGRAVETEEPIIFEDIQSDPKYREMSYSKHSEKIRQRFLAVFPISSKRRAFGAMLISRTHPRSLTAEEVDLLTTMAQQIGIAVENARLFEETSRRADELTLKTLELEEANKVKDEFLSVISHELRTPLNVLMGYTTLMLQGTFGALTGEQQVVLEKVMSQSKDLLILVTDILQAAQIGNRTAKVEFLESDISQLLNDLKIAHDAPPGKDVRIRWNYPATLPAVKTDLNKLRHILSNLIKNAIKFTAQGFVTVSVRITESEQLEFEISDTGIGISQEQASAIFDMFRQADSSEIRPHGGLGIGLYIVRNYTELIGAKLQMTSELGVGSSFTVAIPLVRN